MSVTFPRGFAAAGVVAGLKESGRPDLGLLVAGEGAAAAGAFTTNAFPAAPVVLSAAHLADGRARAVVANSGQANAGTGEPGLRDAEAMAAAAAGVLGCEAADVLVCSTGVIGPRVPIGALRAALPAAAAALSRDGGTDFATAILTTDRRPKQATATAGTWRVGGCVKGAGMIAPSLEPSPLATMLAFVTTDAPATPEALAAILAERATAVWNGVTVDACPSTNDTLLLLAGGAAGGAPVEPGTRAAGELGDAVAAVCEDLARQLVADAEGASRALVVQVDGAADAGAARRVGLAVASSPLVKAAVAGGDPNPGRLLQAVGASGVPFDPSAVRVLLGGEAVIEAGVVADPVPEKAARAMGEPEVVVRVDLGGGPGGATVFGCDLTEEYVRINAEYRT